MKKIMTFAVLGSALALAACNNAEEAPAAGTADTEVVATETPVAEETLDPTGNPIGPNAEVAPVTEAE
jgi:ABC-type glycerol-3-phosphate transport system substrate-binding protein